MTEEIAKKTAEKQPYAGEDHEALQEQIIARLRTVFDPEIPVNIYDLGLIYKIAAYRAPVADLIELEIDMTLTAPGCPVADSILEMVRSILASMPEMYDVKVNLVWEPAWDKSRMTDEARLALDMGY